MFGYHLRGHFFGLALVPSRSQRVDYLRLVQGFVPFSVPDIFDQEQTIRNCYHVTVTSVLLLKYCRIAMKLQI
jgi:hypothetical protein